MLEILLPQILYLLPAFALFYMSVEIYLRNRQSPEHRLAALLTLVFMLWFMGDYFRALFPLEYSRFISINIIFPLTFLSMGLSFRLFAVMTGVEQRLPRPLLYAITYVPLLVVLYLNHTTDWIVKDYVQQGMWKKPVFGLGYAIVIFCNYFYTMFPVYMLWRVKKRMTSERRIKQYNGFMIGISAVITWVVVFSALPELFPYLKEHFPLMVVFGNLFWGVSLWVVMVKYDFLPSYERRFKTLYELFPSAIILLDKNMRIVESNKHATALLGSHHRSGLLDLVVSEERQAFKEEYEANYKERRVLLNKELTIRLCDGGVKHLLIDSDYVEMENEWLQMYILRDISESKEHERQLIESEERYRQTANELEVVTRSTSDGIFVWEVDTGAIHWNDRIYSIFEPKLGEIPANMDRYTELLYPDDVPVMARAFKKMLEGGSSFHIEHRLRGIQDEIVWIYITGEVIRYEDGRSMRVIGSLTDISERKLAEQKIADLAYRDSLTGLHNRLYFNETLESMVETAASAASEEGEPHRLAILLIDLDRFKILNDNWGHEAGDRLLCHVANELEALAGKEHLVARLGGDEFVIVTKRVQDSEQVEELAKQVLYRLEEPFMIGEDGQLFYYSASIGISLFPEDGTDTKTLVRNADIAMYASKEAGRGQYFVYSPNMSLRSSEKMQLERFLRGAWSRDELELYYQPQLDLKSGKLIGAEALLRWNSPELGYVLPYDIIALAEENGFIIPIGEWVLNKACRQAKQWIDELSSPFTISVNVSRYQLQNEFFVARVLQILNDTGLAPSRLCLEITETLAPQDMEENAQVLRQLAEYGIKVSIDDFGVGYSSLNAIKRLPVTEVKIDQSFIRDARLSPDNAAIVKAMISMAQSLGLVITAEGIEEKEQMDFLRAAGCDRGQGYWIGKPAPVQQFEEEFISVLRQEANKFDLE